jgi:hypothetical protein
MRKSKLSKYDCQLLGRRLAKVQEKLLEYATTGFKEEGLNDDMLLCVSLIELGNFIDEKVRDKKDGTGN